MNNPRKPCNFDLGLLTAMVWIKVHQIIGLYIDVRKKLTFNI